MAKNKRYKKILNGRPVKMQDLLKQVGVLADSHDEKFYKVEYGIENQGYLNKIVPEFKLYINGAGWHMGKTFDEAFEKLSNFYLKIPPAIQQVTV